MEFGGSLLDFDPQIHEGMQSATKVLDGLLQGPDFRGKEILELMGRGLSLAEILKLSDAQLDAVFQQASRFLEAGEIVKARELFSLLIRLQSLDERYTYGLATTYQIEGDCRTAGRLYALYLSLNAECVHGRLRLAECLLTEKEYENAIGMFNSVAQDQEACEPFPDLRAYAAEMVVRCERLMAGE